MDNIEKYLEDLKSTSANRRFEACKSLRRMKEIPESAVNALLETANDTDFLVAWEAKKALKSHNIPIETYANESERYGDTKKSDSASRKFLKVFGWIILVGLGLSLLLFGLEGFIFLLAFAGGPVLFLILVIGVIGYFVSSFRDNKTASSTKDTKKTKADMESTDSSE
ncbi:MAG: HEAT repeat domain-containing protein [Anaerolineales bacterium]|nr:HEAT repeat domain-containing protein [Anaerolineales bacterium]